MFLRTVLTEPFLVVVVLLLVGLVMLLLKRSNARTAPENEPEPEDLSPLLADAFIIKPYLQLGNQPALQRYESISILWHTKADSRRWQAQLRVSGDSQWRPPIELLREPVDIATLGEHAKFAARFADLPPGCEFAYRILCDGAIAFAASGKARNGVDQPYTLVVAGDLGEPHQRFEQKIAHQIALTNPDFIVVPGDIVYQRGRVSEYMANLFPVYNADESSPSAGAPLMRSRILMPSAGNHDVGLPNPQDRRDFSQYPDSLGYFLFWSVPLNGPYGSAVHNTPRLEGDAAARAKFLAAAGERYPRIGNYSFDWGNAHWTVLDSNAYVDWTDAELRAWVEADLASAQNATWRIVMFHHPVFSSDGKHVDEQRMRLLTPIFEKWNVDLVYTGHNHCYERTVPLRFQPNRLETKLDTEVCPVDGTFEFDHDYDGENNLRPKGVIYVVDGAAGAKFYPFFKPPADQLKPYTRVYDQSVHSFTLISVDGRKLVARQIGEDGQEVDRYVIEK